MIHFSSSTVLAETSIEEKATEVEMGETTAEKSKLDEIEVTQEATTAEPVNGFSLGDEDASIRQLKMDLTVLNMASFEQPDGTVSEALIVATQRAQEIMGKDKTDYVPNQLIETLRNEVNQALKLGDESNNIHLLKRYLYTLGFLSQTETNVFDSKTKGAVMAYQEALDLYPTGVVNEALLDTLRTQAEGPLTNPMYREDAIQLKADLETLGFGSFLQTNYFGPQTEETLRKLQTYYGLTVTGIADQETLVFIQQVLNSPFQSGRRDNYTVEIKAQLAVANLWEQGGGTTLYGDLTKAAVEAYQEMKGLVVNGIADPVTRQSLTNFATQPLQNGMYREDAIQLKIDLERLGFGAFLKTNYFGPQTERTLLAFQEHFQLSQSGILDQETRSEISALLTTPLRNGQRSVEAVSLKQELAVLGFWDQSNPTMLYGPQTERAVQSFQESEGLPVSGIADWITLSILHEKATGPLQNGMYRNDAITLKEQLMAVGYGSFARTNYFGPQTERVLISFQRDQNISERGYVGEETLIRLSDLLNTPYREGVRDSGTIQIKKYLTVLGYWKQDNPTSLYGPQTKQAVLDFQKDHNLRVTGIVLDDTYAKLKSLAEGPLKEGMYREDAIELKVQLEHVGFGSYVQNDYYGPITARHVRAFQAYYGLSVTGEVNKATKDKLASIYNSPLQNRNRDEAVIQLKQDLKIIGFWLDDRPTNLFGDQTEAAVRAFQAFSDLVVNGIADEVTLRELSSMKSIVLERFDLDAYELEVLRLVNVERQKVGVSPLQADSHLSYIAYMKSKDMSDLGYFAHQSPTYGSPFEMMESFGYQFVRAGENLARNFTSPAAVVNAWMGSPGHRENILNPNYDYIGIGLFNNHWTQLFSSKVY